MHLTSLAVSNLRILSDVGVAPADGLNVFVGPNGSGKTSLLEAVYLLGTGRSFRSRRVADVVRRGEDTLRVGGTLSDAKGERRLGIEKSPEGMRIRFDSEDVHRASRLARILPLVLVTPDSQRILTDGATLRRQYLEWLLFHVEPASLEVGQRYQKLLRQRNAELRQGGPLAPVWAREMEPLAEELHRQRAEHLERVLPLIQESLETLIAIPVEIRYQPGWDVSKGLAGLLTEHEAEERSLGYTKWGPHRADLRITVSGRAAQRVLSRGESKLLVVGLMLGQALCLRHEHDLETVLLVDELASELDEDSRRRFFVLLESVGSQAFVTTVSQDLVSHEAEGLKLFHVEQGEVAEMV